MIEKKKDPWWYLRILDNPTISALFQRDKTKIRENEEAKRKAEATASQVTEINKAIAYNLGFESTEQYFEALKSRNAKIIMRIATNNHCSWEEAIMIMNHQRERKDQSNWETEKSLRKAPQRGSEGERGMAKVDRVRIHQSTRKPPREGPYIKQAKPTWKEKVAESRELNIALEAQRLGLTVDELRQLMVNNEDNDRK